MNPIKEKLYRHCQDYINQSITTAEQAITAAEEAMESETKSTSGDKHETGRAMKQLEVEAFGHRLDEALVQKDQLALVDISRPYEKVETGALVYTSFGNFFIAVSADEIMIDNEEYCIISPDSPIAQAMMNLAAGASFSFRNRGVRISNVQ